MSRNSITPCCAFSATGGGELGLDHHARRRPWWCRTAAAWACPAVAGSVSTRHCRQAPTGSSSGWSQKRGICDAELLGGADDQRALGHRTSKPSMVMVTRSTRTGLEPPTGLDVVTVIGRCRSPAKTVEAAGSNGQPPACRSAPRYSLAEVLQRRRDRAGRAVAQGAERPAEDVVADVEQRVSRSLLGRPARVSSRAQDLHEPVGALAARRALAARLVRVELRPAQHRAHHAGRLVEDLQRLGAEHRARAAPRPRKSSGTSRCSAVSSGVEEPPGVQNFSSCPARMPPARSSSSRSVMPSGASYWPGRVDVAGEREQLEARGLLGAASL